MAWTCHLPYIQSSPYFDPTHTRTGWIGQPPILDRLEVVTDNGRKILQMHTDMGDERGIRLRCICLGDAALRGSRMSARGLCSKVSEPVLPDPLSRSLVLVCALLGVCELTSPFARLINSP